MQENLPGHVPPPVKSSSDDGTVYFRPDPKHYGTIQPRTNRLVEEIDFFKEWDKWNDGLQLKAWTVCTHNTPLGQAYPEYCVRNTYGDPYFYNLCPAFDEVQDYLRALCLDLASHDAVQCITLETPVTFHLPMDTIMNSALYRSIRK